MSVTESDGPVGGSPAESGDKIDRIRDILLGGSLDELNRRLELLEARIGSVQSSLSAEIGRRIDAIESRLSATIEEQSALHGALRQSLDDHASVLRREAAEAQSHLEQMLGVSVARLDADKVDRAALSRTFADLAARLETDASPAERVRKSHG